MARRRKRRSRSCVCGSKKNYPVCCRKYHDRKTTADDPESLMRSRYSAFALGKIDYVIDTTDPEGEAWLDEEETLEDWKDSLQTFSQSTEFQGLEVQDAEVDEEAGEARVTFHAELERGGYDASFTETSKFVRRDGEWMYTDAEETTDELEDMDAGEDEGAVEEEDVGGAEVEEAS